MSESNEKSNIDEPEVIKEETPSKKSEGHFKLYFVLALIIALVGWSLSNYSPLPAFKSRLDNTIQSLNISQPEVEQPEAEQTVVTQEEEVEKSTEEPVQNAPVFEPAYDLTTDAEDETETKEVVVFENLDEVILATQQLQQQVTSLQQTIHNMHAQQLQQSQHLVRSQLFALLQQAAAPQANLLSAATTWKSIGFMPLLSEGKRSLAQQGHEQLHGLYFEIQAVADEISSLITTLTKQLEPDEQADIAIIDNNLSDPYQDVAIEITWLDWLKQQFKVSKVDPATLITPEDPYADTKHLIAELQYLRASITSTQWQNTRSLNKLFYQLEQRALETSITREMIKGFEQTQQSWLNQAQVWMEQL